MNKIYDFRGEYAWLSNFYPSHIVYGVYAFPTVEHAFQYTKQATDNGRAAVMWIPSGPTFHDRRMTTPGEAKRAARRHPMRADWETIKIGVMHDLLRLKFCDPGLRSMLLATGDADLVEGNTWNDNFWGVCNGWGENHLGRLLVLVRNEIRNPV